MTRAQPPRAILALAALLAILPGSARAEGELVIDDLGSFRGMLAVAVRLHQGFDDETRRSVESGLPITVRYTTELWRKRRLWFDKQVDSRVVRYRIRYDPGEGLYSVLDDIAGRAETFASLDAALGRLSPQRLDVHPRWELEERHAYTVTVDMAIQPITLEEFRELDGWISGRLRGDPDSSAVPPAEGGVSGALFGFVRNLAGFGDRIHRTETPPFRPSSLGSLDRGA